MPLEVAGVAALAEASEAPAPDALELLLPDLASNSVDLALALELAGGIDDVRVDRAAQHVPTLTAARMGDDGLVQVVGPTDAVLLSLLGARAPCRAHLEAQACPGLERLSERLEALPDAPIHADEQVLGVEHGHCTETST